jgi:porin
MEFPKLQPISPFKETGPLMINLLGLDLASEVVSYLPHKTSLDNVMVYSNFDQYLYTEQEDPTQGIGLFGRFGWARDDVNPINYFYSLGVGGKGVIPTRDNDTCGIGWYYLDLSNDLPFPFHSEQGIECYYNIEIAPWLHVTPDIQVIKDPGGTSAYDCAWVAGLRVQMNL